MPQGSDQVGTLKGVDEDVPYNADDADSLASACRSSATLIDGQASTRSTAVTTAQEDFQGHFADLFTANAAVQVTDATNLAAALRDVATKVDALTEEARKEQQRRETARAWKRDHDNRGWAEKAWDAVFGEDPPAIGPAATPLNQCVPAPDTGTRETPEPGSAGASGASGGTSSADPADLRSFASTCRTEDDELSNEPTTLRSRYTTFESTCTWGSVDAAGVFTAYDTYLTNNDQDATWADTVAGAFEAAGGTGSVTTLPDAAIQAALDAAGVATERSEITIDLATVQGGALTNGYADDPVNTATGNFIEPEVDLAFTGGCASLALIRVYNATSREPGGFGPGWSSAADSRLDLDQDGARWVHPDGRVSVFPRMGQGWDRAVGESLWLERRSGASGEALVASDNAGGRWTFSPAGVLLREARGTGTAVDHEYSDGRLVRLVHERGRSIELVWDEDAGRVTAAQASDGRRLTFAYDCQGQLVEVAGPGSGRRYEWSQDGLVCRVVDGDGVVEVDNTYDDAGRVSTQRSATGRVTSYSYLPGMVTVVADEDGGRANTWIHDRGGRLIGVVDAHGAKQRVSWDRWGNQVMVVARDGARTVRLFDHRGRLTVEQLPGGTRTTSVWDDQDRLVEVRVSGSGQEHAQEGDDQGAPQRQDGDGRERQDGADQGAAQRRDGGDGSVTRYGYEGDSRHPALIVDPEGGRTELTWAGGVLTRLVDATGVGVDLDYDVHGDLVAVTDGAGGRARLVRDEAGRVTHAVTPMGHRTTYHYDDAGMCVRRTDPDGAVWRFEYSRGGRLLARVDPMGGRTEVTYGGHGQEEAVTDELGRTLTRQVDDLGNLARVGLPDGSTWDFAHDALSRLTAVTDAQGGTWRLEHDEVGRVRAAVDAVGTQRTIECGPDGRPVAFCDPQATWSATYDALGRQATSTDPSGARTLLRHDRCGRVVQVTDPRGATTGYTHDRAGRVLSVSLPTGDVYRYEYDRCGRWCATVSTGGARYEIVYDADWRIVGEVWPTGERVTTTYDRAGRPVSRVEPGAGTRRVGYDRCGRVSWVQDAWYGHRRFAYDAAGQVVAVTNALGGVTRLEYDGVGRLVSSTDPLGGVTRRGYDHMGRLLTLTDPLGRVTRMSYDAAGRMTRRRDADGATRTWTYDDAGRLAEERLGDRLVRQLSRDLVGRSLTVTAPTGRDADGRDVTRTWDEAGHLVQERRGTLLTSYTYDVAGRCTTMTRPDGVSTSYDYDQEWNLSAATTQGGGRVGVERDLIGRPVSAHGPGLSVSWQWEAGFVVREEVRRHGQVLVTTLERDGAGRITSRVVDGERTDYSYDAGGALVAVSGPDGIRRTYTYDAGGRLVGEDGPDGATSSTYDAAGQLTSRTTTHGVTRYSYDAAGRRRGQVGPDGERRFSYDEHGDLVRVASLSRDGDRLRGRRVWELGRDSMGAVVDLDGAQVSWDATAQVPSPTQVGGAPVELAAGVTTVVGGQEPGSEPTWGGWAQRPADPWEAPLRGATTPGDGEGGLTASGSLLMDDLVVMGQRVYDPASRSFLTTDPLAAPPGAAWGASPYSFAGNDPVNQSDPWGLSPVSDADLSAYGDAHTGGLSHAWNSAKSWLSDNWQYVAAAAVVATGVVLVATGVGAGVGAGILIGAAASGTFSAGSQLVTTGSVDWRTVATDTAIGGVAGAVGGGVGAAATRATARTSMSCLGRNVLTGAAEGVADGGVSSGLTYLTGPGPHTVGGLAQATGEGAVGGAAMGGAGGAFAKVTGVSSIACFTAGTGVVMADGTTVPIEEVEVGDQVSAWNPVTGQCESRAVVETFTRQEAPTWQVVTSDGGEVTTTEHHPFLTTDRGWVEARDLRPGEVLGHLDQGRTGTAQDHSDGARAETGGSKRVAQPVTVVSVAPTGQTSTVHNLHVQGLHNYHVTTTTGTALTVHNTCGDPAAEVQRIAREVASEGRESLLSGMTRRQREAAARSPWLSNMFTGHAVHNATFEKLKELYGKEFTYNPSKGPDFYHKASDTYIELTTPSQVNPHKNRARYDERYDGAEYPTYDLPLLGS